MKYEAQDYGEFVFTDHDGCRLLVTGERSQEEMASLRGWSMYMFKCRELKQQWLKPWRTDSDLLLQTAMMRIGYNLMKYDSALNILREERRKVWTR